MATRYKKIHEIHIVREPVWQLKYKIRVILKHLWYYFRKLVRCIGLLRYSQFCFTFSFDICKNSARWETILLQNGEMGNDKTHIPHSIRYYLLLLDNFACISSAQYLIQIIFEILMVVVRYCSNIQEEKPLTLSSTFNESKIKCCWWRLFVA